MIQIESNQIKSNQIKSNQIKSNQIKEDELNSQRIATEAEAEARFEIDFEGMIPIQFQSDFSSGPQLTGVRTWQVRLCNLLSFLPLPFH